MVLQKTDGLYQIHMHTTTQEEQGHDHRTTSDTTPTTVTLPSCEACINEQGEGGGAGVCRCVRWEVHVVGEPTGQKVREEEEELTSRRQAELESPRSC